ncbi:MAG TPA: CYCXC family (seleno)protein [Vicinamibacteria bacterium]|nr:CYCXC family (seleno)protein [Vicinamibacteria bacterium]
MPKKRKQPAPQEPVAEKLTSTGNAGRFAALALLVAGGGVFVYALSQEGAPKPPPPLPADQTEAVEPRDPGQDQKFRYFEDPAQAHPLPVTLPPSQFQNQGIAGTYVIAKEIPEVLAQQPCLCGCDNTSDDHRSLLDCYIDEHASTCIICMKEAVLAKQMTDAGRSARDIREAILRHDYSNVSIGN